MQITRPTDTWIRQGAIALRHREVVTERPDDTRSARERYYEDQRRARRQRLDAEQSEQSESVDIYRTGWRCQGCDAALAGPEDAACNC